MIWLIMGLLCSAKELPGEELFVAPVSSAETPLQQDGITTDTKPGSNINPTTSTKLTKKIRKGYNPNKPDPSGNMPAEYIVTLGRQSTASELIQPPKGSSEIYRGLKVGDIFDVKVLHSVIAFPDEKAPVIASAQNGSLSGLRFIGESYLEKNSKRIFINFTRLAIGQQAYELKGVGVSIEGQPGLTGEYHSREAEYFTGDFIASFAAGYFDGLVPRRTNAFGQIDTDPSIDSAVKKGLASGALSTADRFREKLKKVPEFSEIKGPFDLKILILEQAKTTN